MCDLTENEIHRFRKLFPVTQNWVYLNHAGVAPVSAPVAHAVAAFNQQALEQGYTASGEWSRTIAGIRRQAARLINAAPEEIAFVKNTSHGISLVARGLGLKPGDEVVISEVEFPANVYPWMALEKSGVVLRKISCRNGELQMDSLKNLFTPRTKVVSLSSVQYGNGYRLPVAEVGRLCRDRGVYFCLDAIQSLGAFPLDVHTECVDFMAADAHKWMLGHEGIGIFYVRKELMEKLEPILLGWNSVEGALEFDKIHFHLRPSAERYEEGSHNAMSIYGMGAALDLLLEVGVERIADRILHLTEILLEGLDKLKMELTCSREPRFRSGIVTCRIPEDVGSKRTQELERYLFSQKIYASVRQGSLRFSPHFYNNEEEINRTLELVAEFQKSRA